LGNRNEEFCPVICTEVRHRKRWGLRIPSEMTLTTPLSIAIMWITSTLTVSVGCFHKWCKIYSIYSRAFKVFTSFICSVSVICEKIALAPSPCAFPDRF
jgi:hypothetical protein